MDKVKYLRRIGIEKSELPLTFETIKLLQKQHLLNVPFENLDIHWKRPIALDTEKFYEKIVGEKRGGFCYELNGLFYELLSEVGFTSRIISARVYNGKDFNAEYDHLAILTKIKDEEFLVDVGFGDFTAAPLKFMLSVEQQDANGVFLIRKFDEDYFEVVKKEGEYEQSEYIFKNSVRDLSEFSEMCRFHQTSPQSHFTWSKLCSLMLENGRKTLTDKEFIETENGEKRKTKINSEDEFYDYLAREFRIERCF